MNPHEWDIVTEAEEQFTNVYDGTNVKVYANQHYVFLYLTGEMNITSANTWQNTNGIALNSDYRPPRNLYFRMDGNADDRGVVLTTGFIQVAMAAKGTNILNGGIMYPRKSVLP